MTPTTSSPSAKPLYSGRYEDAADPLFREINDSLPIDWRLVRHDIAGSIAWAEALHHADVLSADESSAITAGLAALYDHAQTIHDPPIESGAEDVHTWVELQLTQHLSATHGDLGKKLHTGRSRNDQVATDLRLWAIEAIAERIAEAKQLGQALLALAQRSYGIAMPAYTHLQPAQPVLAAHWCLAYVEMLERDITRLQSAAQAANACPLGSAALAGTTYPVNREAIAARLGFSRITRNSLDAVSDRDFVLDALSAAAICAVHLSKLAEELIIFATNEFNFISLEDAMTSGSSLMPQKKNPDALELVRGKSGTLLAAFQSLAVTLKGTPLAYNKDFQEDKHTLFTSLDTLSLCLRAATRTITGITFNADRCQAAASAGGTLATELADHLVAQGIPFRDAHEIVGHAVRVAESTGTPIESWTTEQFQKLDARFGADVTTCLTLAAVLSRREIPGGTGPNHVAAALQAAQKRIVSIDSPVLTDLVSNPACIANAQVPA